MSSRLRSEPIAALDLPDETLSKLRDVFRARPRIVEAWAVGYRLDPLDDTPPYEATLIGLKLDPPLDSHSDRAAQKDFVDLTRELGSASGFGNEQDQGWEVFNETAAQEHPGHATLIYSI